MKNHRKSKVSFVKTFHKTIDKLFTNVYNMSCKNFIKKPKKIVKKVLGKRKGVGFMRKRVVSLAMAAAMALSPDSLRKQLQQNRDNCSSYRGSKNRDNCSS